MTKLVSIYLDADLERAVDDIVTDIINAHDSGAIKAMAVVYIEDDGNVRTLFCSNCFYRLLGIVDHLKTIISSQMFNSFSIVDEH